MTRITQLIDYGFEQVEDLKSIEGKEILFINGIFFKSLPNLIQNNSVKIYQPLFTLAQPIQQKVGDHVHSHFPPSIMPESQDIIFLNLSKDSEENLFHLAYALVNLKPEGMLVCFGTNEIGAPRYEKELKKLGLETDHIFKFKARSFWTTKCGNLNTALLSKWLQYGTEKTVPETDLTTVPGIFSRQKIDKGSRLLIEHLPDKLDGFGADFGCGYGYLGYTLFTQNKAQNLVCIDNDQRALDCARHNLEPLETPEDAVIVYLWKDILHHEFEGNSFDWIVMNPPFHDDKEETKALGQGFIKKAAQSLKKKASLYMVANKHLPYEDILEKHFTKTERVTEEQGYKIFCATK